MLKQRSQNWVISQVINDGLDWLVMNQSNLLMKSGCHLQAIQDEW